MKTRLIVSFFILLSLAVRTSFAQGTGFTYNGRLSQSGGAARGLYDLTFTVWTAPAGPAQVGPTVTALNIPANNGQFTVTLDFGPGVFNGAARWLEIGVRVAGDRGAFTTLTPRQQLTPAPYAVHAVTARAVTDPIEGGSIVKGSISGAQIAPGAVTAENISRNSITASHLTSRAALENLVASGLVVMSMDDNPALAGTEILQVPSGITVSDAWVARSRLTAPVVVAGHTNRDKHTAVWTGVEMIIWGGENTQNTYLGDGARYNPAANNWTTVTTVGAPAARFGHTAVWTGTEMIVWGGTTPVPSDSTTGGRYNPISDSWAPPMPPPPPPDPLAPGVPFRDRIEHTAVWTDKEMIIFGGRPSGLALVLGDGSRFNPLANGGAGEWTNIVSTPQDPLPNIPSARRSHTAVWTGNEMILWGGFGGAGAGETGARYAPGVPGGRGIWTPLPSAPSTAPGTPFRSRHSHAAVWNGTEMIVWGGFEESSQNSLNDGARFNPATSAWTLIPGTLPNTPSARNLHTAVRRNDEMIVWGGRPRLFQTGELDDGARFNPAGAGSWTALNTVNKPPGRNYHTAVWTGTRMIVFGGRKGTDFLSDTWSFVPSSTLKILLPP